MSVSRHDGFQALKIAFGGAQAVFSLPATGRQTDNASGFFENLPTLDRFGVDDRGDTALRYDRRRAGTGTSVGKQQFDFASGLPGLVDAVIRPLAALDPARHADGRVLGVLRWQAAITVRQNKFDLRHVTGGSVRGAIKDDFLHIGTAKLLGPGFTHDPFQRLDDVGFATAIGANYARDSRLDVEIGRVNKALEALNSEFRKRDQMYPRFRPRVGRPCVRFRCQSPPSHGSSGMVCR